ncbi:hypothetical protein COOONC_14857 [Cooperia oncophora]
MLVQVQSGDPRDDLQMKEERVQFENVWVWMKKTQERSWKLRSNWSVRMRVSGERNHGDSTCGGSTCPFWSCVSEHSMSIWLLTPAEFTFDEYLAVWTATLRITPGSHQLNLRTCTSVEPGCSIPPPMLLLQPVGRACSFL